MRPFLYSLLFVLLTVSGCKKSDSLADLIVGKWQQASTTNGATITATATNIYVKFNDDGTLSGNAFPGASAYKVDASAKTISLTGGLTYSYTFADNQLILSVPNALIANNQRYNKVL